MSQIKQTPCPTNLNNLPDVRCQVAVHGKVIFDEPCRELVRRSVRGKLYSAYDTIEPEITKDSNTVVLTNLPRFSYRNELMHAFSTLAREYRERDLQKRLQDHLKAFNEFNTLLEEFCVLCAKGLEDSPEADQLREIGFPLHNKEERLRSGLHVSNKAFNEIEKLIGIKI